MIMCVGRGLRMIMCVGRGLRMIMCVFYSIIGYHKINKHACYWYYEMWGLSIYLSYSLSLYNRLSEIHANPHATGYNDNMRYAM